MTEALKHTKPDSPLITIIIPSFNAKYVIQQALQSIYAQTCRDFEVLVVDGLSTDGSLKIIQNFAGRFDLQVIAEKDDGIYDAMNKGIRKAKGEWLYFMGADDLLVNEEVLKLIIPFLNKENDLVYGDSMWMPDRLTETGEWSYEKLLYQSINHQRIFYRKSLFEEFGSYNLHYKVASDLDLNIRFFCNEKIRKKYVPVLVALYHTGGFSSNRFDEKFWQNWDITIKKPFISLLSDKKIYGSLGTYIRFLINKKRYKYAFKLMIKHFYHTRSAGFQLLMLNFFLKNRSAHAG